MHIYAKISLTFIFSFLWFTIMILSCTSILPVSQLQTQQLMTSQIRSNVEYLLQPYNILMLILYSKVSKNNEKSSALTVFNTI